MSPGTHLYADPEIYDILHAPGTGPADPAGADSPTQTTDQPSGSTGEPPT